MSTGKPLDIIAIIGSTATGKTKLAVQLASRLKSEIISADSRQVYIGMDIGTGKDLNEYNFNNQIINYHLIDIVSPINDYSIFDYQNDFDAVFFRIKSNTTPILCGGSGLYIETALGLKNFPYVPENKQLRFKLKEKTLKELTEILSTYKELHNTTDTEDLDRCIRAIEIEKFKAENPQLKCISKKKEALIFAIKFPRDIIKQNITNRLSNRLKNGMIEEVKTLLDSGLTHEKLKFFGLEYKYISQYLEGSISFEEMFRLLNIAIQQFAKRQETWWRKMERDGIKINWIDGFLPDEEKLNAIMNQLQHYQ